MIIEENDFRLESVTDSDLMFDLELLHTVKPKGGEERQEFKIDGYGLPLESAIKHIVQYRISKGNKEGSLTMSRYLEEFKKIYKDVKSLCIMN